MRRAALLAAGLLVTLAVVAQVVLPGIAERRVRDELRTVGDVSGVRVRAFPAVKLLWGNVDFLGARVDGGRAEEDEIGSLLDRTRNIDELRVTAPRLAVGGLALGDVRVDKQGGRLSAAATVAAADLTALAPGELTVTDVAAEGGRLTFGASASMFGQTLAGRAAAVADGGAIVLAPEGPLGAVARYTAFSEPRVRVQSVSARDAGPDRLRLMTTGRLR